MRRRGRNRFVGAVLATGLLVSVVVAVAVGAMIVENRKQAAELRNPPSGDTTTPGPTATKASPPGDVHREPATACAPLEGGPVAGLPPLREGTPMQIGEARLSSCRGIDPRGRATIGVGLSYYADPLPAGAAGAQDSFGNRRKSADNYRGGVRGLSGLGQRAFTVGNGDGVEVVAYDGNLLVEVDARLVGGKPAALSLARQIAAVYLRGGADQ